MKKNNIKIKQSALFAVIIFATASGTMWGDATPAEQAAQEITQASALASAVRAATKSNLTNNPALSAPKMLPGPEQPTLLSDAKMPPKNILNAEKLTLPPDPIKYIGNHPTDSESYQVILRVNKADVQKFRESRDITNLKLSNLTKEKFKSFKSFEGQTLKNGKVDQIRLPNQKNPEIREIVLSFPKNANEGETAMTTASSTAQDAAQAATKNAAAISEKSGNKTSNLKLYTEPKLNDKGKYSSEMGKMDLITDWSTVKDNDKIFKESTITTKSGEFIPSYSEASASEIRATKFAAAKTKLKSLLPFKETNPIAPPAPAEPAVAPPVEPNVSTLEKPNADVAPDTGELGKTTPTGKSLSGAKMPQAKPTLNGKELALDPDSLRQITPDPDGKGYTVRLRVDDATAATAKNNQEISNLKVSNISKAKGKNFDDFEGITLKNGTVQQVTQRGDIVSGEGESTTSEILVYFPKGEKEVSSQAGEVAPNILKENETTAPRTLFQRAGDLAPEITPEAMDTAGKVAGTAGTVVMVGSAAYSGTEAAANQNGTKGDRTWDVEGPDASEQYHINMMQ